MIRLNITIERWAMREPFVIARETIIEQPVVTLQLTDERGNSGYAEAAGVDYAGETLQSISAQISAVQQHLHDALGYEELMHLLPAGGARNAMDCALWDLRAKQSGIPVWRAAGLTALKPVTTAFTLGLSDDATTRRKAREARNYPLLKLKVDARRHIDVVRLVRKELPQARLVVDANQSWTLDLLKTLLPLLHAEGVELVEQPLPQGQDSQLDALQSPIALAADESCTDRSSLPDLVGRYQYINIKLDKCGGLTEGLALAAEAAKYSMGLMVGNMCGSSLAMAPAFLLAQQCEYVDLDGPLLQKIDRANAMSYTHGLVLPPHPALWG